MSRLGCLHSYQSDPDSHHGSPLQDAPRRGTTRRLGFLCIDLSEEIYSDMTVLASHLHRFESSTLHVLCTSTLIMPPHGLRLPTIPTHDVASHNSEKSCYVTVGANVYNVTSFLPDHPGGGDLILEYGGKDVSEIMGDELSHVHSDAAYEILNDNLIGFVANETKVKAVVEHDRPEDIVPMLPNKAGMVALKADGITGIPDMKPVFAPTGLSSIEDPTKEIDGNANMKTHKFLDLNRPLLPQVWNRGFSKDFYLEQVHRPRYYSGGDSAPMFGNLLEPLTLTAWWIVPVVWLPPVLYMTFLAYRGIGSAVRTAEYFIVGLGFWTLVEYGVHRVSHADK